MRGFTLRALFALLPLGVGCRDDRDGPLLGPVDLSGLDPGFETYTGSDSALIFENGYVARIVASNAVVHGGATGAGYDLPSRAALARLAQRIWACRRCPRLAAYLDRARQRWPDHACRPVPGWGDPRARLIIVGLAPGLHGAGRTGRMFNLRFERSMAVRDASSVRLGLAARFPGPRGRPAASRRLHHRRRPLRPAGEPPAPAGAFGLQALPRRRAPPAPVGTSDSGAGPNRP